MLKDPSWKYDIMPVIWDGKNVADFIDPEIEEKLLALEREEDELMRTGFYDNSELEMVRAWMTCRDTRGRPRKGAAGGRPSPPDPRPLASAAPLTAVCAATPYATVTGRRGTTPCRSG